MAQEYRKAFSLSGLTEKYTAATKAAIEANFTRFAALIRSINPYGELPSGSEDQMLVYVDGAWIAQDQPSVTPSAWVLVATQVAAGAASYDFTGLSGYSDILVVARAATLSALGILAVRVSTDNGATFLAAAGDYVGVAGTGVETAGTSVQMYSATATAARSGFVKIEGFNVAGAPKPCHTNFFSVDGIGFRLATNTSAYNALRVLNTGAGNITGGTIYVFGKP